MNAGDTSPQERLNSHVAHTFACNVRVVGVVWLWYGRAAFELLLVFSCACRCQNFSGFAGTLLHTFSNGVLSKGN